MNSNLVSIVRFFTLVWDIEVLSLRRELWMVNYPKGVLQAVHTGWDRKRMRKFSLILAALVLNITSNNQKTGVNVVALVNKF